MSDLSSNPLLGLFKNACHYGSVSPTAWPVALREWSSGHSAGKESACNAGDPSDPSLIPGSGRSTGEGMTTHSVFLGFPVGSAGKECACDAGDPGSFPGLGRSPGEGNCYPLQYSGLENLMDCIVHGVAKRWTQPSDFHFHFFHVQIIFKAEMTLPHKVSLKAG